MARRNFPNEDPVGRRISFDDGKTFWTIAGVVADVHQQGVTIAPKAQVYISHGTGEKYNVKEITLIKPPGTQEDGASRSPSQQGRGFEKGLVHI